VTAAHSGAGYPGAAHPGNGAHEITLLTRPGCHLCDDARAVIARVAAELGVAWQERDITQSPDDLRAYGEMIPVTLIDGRQHDFWRVSEPRLRAALGAGPGRSPGGADR
jgi:glutaredoxin